jgi:hypothetical protein
MVTPVTIRATEPTAEAPCQPSTQVVPGRSDSVLPFEQAAWDGPSSKQREASGSGCGSRGPLMSA